MGEDLTHLLPHKIAVGHVLVEPRELKSIPARGDLTYILRDLRELIAGKSGERGIPSWIEEERKRNYQRG